MTIQPRLVRLVGLFLVLALLPQCSTVKPDPVAPDELVIVSTTDLNGNVGQAEGLASVIGGLRQRFGDHMIYLDGGNLFQGSLQSNLTKGRAMVAMYNQLGLDAAAVGNHDFDYGPDVEGRTFVKPGEDGLGNLKARVREAHFQWLSANFVDKGAPVFAAHAVFQRGGHKVCVIGATTPETRSITNPAFLGHAHFEPLAKTIAAEARKLREGEKCDYVLLVAHAGAVCSADGSCLSMDRRNELPAVLASLPPHTVDAVVGGHTRAFVAQEIHGTPVLQAGSGGYEVGVLRLRPGQDARFEPFIEVPDEPASSSDTTKMTEALKPFHDQAYAVAARELGQASASFIPMYSFENPLGNLVADAFLEAGKKQGATVALMNAGGVRAPLLEGKINYARLFLALPYDNALAIVKLKGSELTRLLAIAFSGARGMPSVAGLRIKRVSSGSKTVVEARTADGQKIVPKKIYTLATLDYLAAGGENQGQVYQHVPASRRQVLESVLARDVVAAYIKAHSPLDPDRYYDPGHLRVSTAGRSK